MALESRNPATGELIRSYPEMTPAEAGAAIAGASAAFPAWRAASFADRSRPLASAAALLRARKDELARLAALEMGKPVAQGRAEVEKCAWACEHFAAHAADMLVSEEVRTSAAKSYVAFEPLGVLLAVMPWNFPFWQVFRCAAPALMAGNAVVLKHASNVTGCALACEELLRIAGLPEGLFRAVLVPSARAPELIADSRIAAVSLTGSTEAGRAVAALAGSHLKKSVLELGGSDPYLILADADLERAAETCAAARLVNSGQSCVAAKRFIAVAAVRARFEALLVARLREAVMGDPRREDVTVGPLARADLREALHDQVRRSVAAGARVLLGGDVPSGPGAFYPPTVLSGVTSGMAVADEETFGPVAAVIEAPGEDDAVRIANATVFGLGAAVFTRDLARGEAVARRLEAGNCFVNAFVTSDPRLPFGGIKASGYGRELGVFGLREFVNLKTVSVA